MNKTLCNDCHFSQLIPSMAEMILGRDLQDSEYDDLFDIHFDLLNEDFDVTEHGWRDSGVDIAEAILGTSEDDEELADQLVRAYLEGAEKYDVSLSIDFAEPEEESEAEEEMLKHLHRQSLTLIKDWRERIMQHLERIDAHGFSNPSMTKSTNETPFPEKEWDDELQGDGSESEDASVMRTTEQKEPLTQFGMLYRENLRKHRPKEYRSLKESGDLDSHVLQIQEQAKLELSQLLDQGLSYDMAYEKVSRETLYPPSESPNRL